jgi:hypothetical protein
VDATFACVTNGVVKSSKCIRYSAIGSVLITMFVVFIVLVSSIARRMLKALETPKHWYTPQVSDRHKVYASICYMKRPGQCSRLGNGR